MLKEETICKKEVGTVVKNLRLEMGFTQSELSEGICSTQHLYRIENSKRLPSAYLINLLAVKLGKKLIEEIYSADCWW